MMVRVWFEDSQQLDHPHRHWGRPREYYGAAPRMLGQPLGALG